MEARQVRGPVYDPKPGTVTAIAVMTLVSGIVNVLWALGLTVTVVLGTLGIGLLCVPVTILPAVLGSSRSSTARGCWPAHPGPRSRRR